MATICALAVVLAGVTAYGWHVGWFAKSTSDGNTATPQTSRTSALPRTDVPSPKKNDAPAAQAQRAVSAMTLEERVGQLVMVPLFAGSDPSSLASTIADEHIGSAVLIGNWNTGVDTVKTATAQLQGYAPAGNRLIIATDQEGGQVQHLTGTGFDTMPSAVEQGTMSADALRQSAGTWGSQLAAAGINVDLAPVLGTVVGDRASNAPIGALDRDFGLDAAGNAEHGIAVIEGLRGAQVGAAVKHYPGLGAVSGNTDFTTEGILDTTTTLDGAEAGAFDQAITKADPAMVMMSLATYQSIDPNNPAVFSSTIIDGHIRNALKYTGVVISDSISAEALSSYDVSQLGVKLVEAGGDMSCIGQTDYVKPVVDGLNERAKSDSAFASKVTAAATRVMTLKIKMGLA